MRTKTFFQRIPFGLFTTLFLVFAAASVNAQCPSPTVKNAAGECTLTTDVELKETLVLPSNTTLNCQLHRMVPRLGDRVPRKFPQVAIFLDTVENVQIKHCFIDTFDFGILAINSKSAPFRPPIQILHNVIQARFAGITLMSVDEAEVRDNVLRLTVNGGKGIYVGRNSDRNRILDNEIGVSIPREFNDTKVFRVPGPDLPSNRPIPTPAPTPNGTTPLAGAAGSAMLITHTEGPEPSLLYVIFEGDTAFALCNAKKCLLRPLAINFSAEPNEDFSEGNTIERNTIRINTGTLSVDGLVLAIPQATRVSNNTVIGAKSSIRVGIQSGPPPNGTKKQFPGQCSNSGRDCLGTDDCNIPDVDATLNGSCPLPAMKSVFWVSNNTIIQDNLVVGPFEAGISTTGRGTIITSNTITRPTNAPLATPKTGTGIVLVGRSALELDPLAPEITTVVSRNIVKDIKVGLNLIQSVPLPPGQPSFAARNFDGAKISLNDFTGHDTPVVISRAAQTADNTYSLKSELSAILENMPIPRGNFWGRTCAQGGFIPGDVKNSDGSQQVLLPQPLVTDSHPFGTLVAFIHGLPGSAPTPCP